MKNAQRGVGLVEALVALVVLAVGMLGIAALFVESIRANRSAFARTQAVYFANDLADRIRTNRFGRDGYGLAIGDLPALPGTPCVGADNCTPANLAQDDLARWVLAVRTALPASAAGDPPRTSVVVVPAANTTQPDRYTITVGWDELGNQAYNYQLDMQVVRGAVL